MDSVETREMSHDSLATGGMKSKGNSMSSVLLLTSRRNESIDSARQETNDLRNIARTLLRTLVVPIGQYETRRETGSVDEETKAKNSSKGHWTPAGTGSMGPIVHWLQTCHDLVVSKLMKMTRKAVTIGLCPYTPPPFKTKSDTEKKKMEMA